MQEACENAIWTVTNTVGTVAAGWSFVVAAGFPGPGVEVAAAAAAAAVERH